MPYQHLSVKERYVIYHLSLYGLSYREIGRRLGRSHTTIMREIDRNSPDDIDYSPEVAQRHHLERRCRPQHCRRWNHKPLRAYVEQGLTADWSPEQIAGRLRCDFPRSRAMRIGVETIYRWIYRDAADGGTLYTHLRFRHRYRRKQRRFRAGNGPIRDRVGISARPLSVDERRYFGDWEGDSVEGAKGSGTLVTHVERKSRYLLAAPLADKKARTMTDGSIRLFTKVPEKARRSLTLDNGSEFADFKRLETHSGLTVYFADPYAPYQRGTNENTNGLLRQYFPKGQSLSRVTKKEVEKAMERLNHRPRKCLGFKTPHEVLNKATGGALEM